MLNSGSESEAEHDQQNLHLATSSSLIVEESSSFTPWVMLSTSSYSSNSSSRPSYESMLAASPILKPGGRFCYWSTSILSLYLISFTANFTLPTFIMSPYFKSYSYNKKLLKTTQLSMIWQKLTILVLLYLRLLITKNIFSFSSLLSTFEFGWMKLSK